VWAVAAHAAAPEIEALLDNGYFRKARAEAEAAFRAHPQDARTAWLLARVRLAFQDADEAVKYAELAVRLDPRPAAYHHTLSNAYAKQIGKLPFYKQLGQSKKIRAELDAALALAPQDGEILADRIEYLLEAPGIAGGDKRKAAELAEELAKRDPARGFVAMAHAAQKQSESPAKVVELFRKAADAGSDRARLWLASWYAEASHRDYRQMEQQAAAVVELHPERIGGYRLLAYALAAQKRPEEAARVLTRAEATIPDDLSPYVFAGRGLFAAGADLERAEQYLHKYLDATPEPEPGAPPRAGVHRSLALIYERLGRKGDAVRELEAARQDVKRLK
jgi:tetratricopeptide (TPR) repeat protein